MEIVADPTAAAIIEHVRSTLASVTSGGVSFFAGAPMIVDDVESFVNVSDALAGPTMPTATQPGKPQVGVVVADVDSRPGTTSSENTLYHMPLDILLRFALPRGPMADEKAAVIAAKQFGDVVQRAILFDKTRGGKCGLVTWEGRIINGTETRGAVRMLGGPPNQMFYSVSVPAECAWYD